MMFRWLHDWLGRNSAHHAMLQIIESSLIEHPEEWAVTTHTRDNSTRSLSLWTSNGPSHCRLYDGPTWFGSPEIKTSSYWKKRLWNAHKGSRVSVARCQQIVDRFRNDFPSRVNVVAFPERRA